MKIDTDGDNMMNKNDKNNENDKNSENKNDKRKRGNIHDQVFKSIMDIKTNAEAFIRNFIPEDVVSHMDFSTLRKASGELIDSFLGNSQIDVLYQVDYVTDDGERRNVFVYAMIEHKSYIDLWMVAQILFYLVKLWEDEHSKKGFTKLTHIIPIILYHGKDKILDKHRNFKSVFRDDPLLNRYLPNFEPVIVNMNDKSVHDINGPVEYVISMLTIKYSHKHTDDYYADVKYVLKDVSISRKKGPFFSQMRTILFYAYEVRKDNDVMVFYVIA